MPHAPFFPQDRAGVELLYTMGGDQHMQWIVSYELNLLLYIASFGWRFSILWPFISSYKAESFSQPQWWERNTYMQTHYILMVQQFVMSCVNKYLPSTLDKVFTTHAEHNEPSTHPLVYTIRGSTSLSHTLPCHTLCLVTHTAFLLSLTLLSKPVLPHSLLIGSASSSPQTWTCCSIFSNQSSTSCSALGKIC